MQLVGAPPQPDLFFQLAPQILLVLTGDRQVRLQPLQQMGHTPLLVTNGVANDLGGVSGEHQPDVEFLQQVLHLAGWDIHPAEPLEHFAEGGRIGLAGQGWCEGIEVITRIGLLAPAGPEAVEVAVLFDALLEDVDQLEIEGESPGRGDRLGEVHRPDQLDDRFAGALPVPTFQGHGITELLETQQSFALLRRALTAQHGLPEVLHQLKAVLQQAASSLASTAGPGLFAVGSLGGGLGHRSSAGRVTGHDHPKAGLGSWSSCSWCSMASLPARSRSAIELPRAWASRQRIA